jgi:uncharacterized protein YycO
MDVIFRLACLVVLVAVASEPRAQRRTAARQQPRVELHEADVVLQTSGSARSALIQRASGSPYSHVGLVELAPDGVFVVEAISPVSRTPIEAWAARGKGHVVTVLRPVGLDAAARQQVVETAKGWLGRPYDARYAWDDERLYCSELVVKAFARGARLEVGRQQRVKDLQVTTEELAWARSLDVDPEQRLVTPGSLVSDPHFEVVAKDVRW